MSAHELEEELEEMGVVTARILDEEDLTAAVDSFGRRVETSASAEATCSHCGKQGGVELKHCTRCRQDSYNRAGCRRRGGRSTKGRSTPLKLGRFGSQW